MPDEYIHHDAPAAARATATARATASRWLHQSVGRLSDAVATAFAEVSWYPRLSAHSRSWVRLVVYQELAAMARSLAASQAPSLHNVFSGVPADVTREISLDHTVELLQVTVDVVLRVVNEEADGALDAATSDALRAGLERYGREVAFHAAAVYAKAAENRGRAVSRRRAQLIEALVDGREEQIVARAADLLPLDVPVRVLGMLPPPTAAPTLLDEIVRVAGRLGVTACGAVRGKAVVVVAAGEPAFTEEPVSARESEPVRQAGSGREPGSGAAAGPSDLAAALGTLVGGLGGQGIVASEIVPSVAHAAAATAAVLSGLRALAARPGGPPVVSTDDLLLERVLCGDQAAARQLVASCVDPLVGAGHGLIETVDAMLRCDGSPEAAARSLPVHVNTLRYRLTKIISLTGQDPRRFRDATALRIAFTLARTGVTPSALSA